MRGLIVSGGSVDDELVCREIKNGGYDIVIAVDSGMEVLYRHHLTPDIIVGDFDSVSPEALSFFRKSDSIEFEELNTVKDDTDTEYALRDAITRGVRSVTILGGTGSRIDHELGNILLLGAGLSSGVEVELLDTHNRVRMIDEPIKIRKKEQYGTAVSLIPFSDQVTGVTLTGFKYNLSEYTMKGFNTLGISNEIVDEEATVSLESGYLLVIESRD
jgi:thiamine pyrophosphokinase